MIKPFLKWAGGKTQLINQIENHFPKEILQTKKITKYFEPFIGGGALLIYLLQTYTIDEVYISDINLDLINAYKIVKNNPEELIIHLEKYQNLYNSIENKQELFLKMREAFNSSTEDTLRTPPLGAIIKTAQLIFLNKTCFNGLYRLNSKGKFNVPFGKYINPKISDKQNILSLSQLLTNTNIQNASYKNCLEYIDSDSFIYLDPPYKPLTKTANFNSYTQFAFKDNEQIELAEFCKLIHQKGAKFLLSNSALDNSFFENLYSGFNINKIQANRTINSKGNQRGKIDELLICNF